MKTAANGLLLQSLYVIVLHTVLGAAVLECAKPHCTEAGCSPTPCHNGECTESGECKCTGCWTGENCDIYKNVHPPEFMRSVYRVRLDPSTSPGQFVDELQAVDQDAFMACSGPDGGYPCPCSQITYSIVSGNEDDMFALDEQTGVMTTRQWLFESPAREFKLEVEASNEPQGGATGSGITDENDPAYIRSRAVVYIFMDGGAEYDMPHMRVRRNAPYPVEDYPENVTFYLYKTGEYENVTEMMVGSRIHFELQIHLPQDETDILVELFTPDNDTTVMVICGAAVTHAGSNLVANIYGAVVNPIDVKPVMESKDGSTNYDRAVLNFGNVTNSGLPASPSFNSLIVIEWDAVMIQNNDTVLGSTYWASAGAEYNNEEEIWVGQASITAVAEDPIVSTPSFNLTGPDVMQVGSSAVFRVDMYIPLASVALTFDAFAPINNSGVMSVCSVAVAETGEYFDCIEPHKLTTNLYPATGGANGNARARLDLGTVTNKGSRDATKVWAKNLIAVEFVLYLWDDPSLADQEFWVGAAVEVGPQQIWAGQIQVFTAARSNINITESPVVTMTTMNDLNVTVGETVVFVVDAVVAAHTEADYELELLMPYNASAAQAKLCSVSLVYRGYNLPCTSDYPIVYSSRGASDVYDRAVWPLGRILNTGHRSEQVEPNANLLRFQVVAQIANHTLNTVDEKVWITAGLKYDKSTMWVGQNAVIIDDGQGAELTNDTAPTFNLTYSFGTDQVHVGATTEVLFEISTQQGKTLDPLDIEVILPFNDTAMLSLCRVELVHAGRNLPCVDTVKANADILYTSKASGAIMDKAALSLGYVCNIGGMASASLDSAVVPAPEDDTIIISIVVTVEDHALFVDGMKNWISVGVMYHEAQMWVGQLALYVVKDTPLDYSPGELPYFEVVRADNVTTWDHPVGRTVGYDLIIKPPPQSTADVYVTADVFAEVDLSICYIHLKQIGRNIGCLNQNTANYTERSGLYTNEDGVIYVGKVTNIGAGPVDNTSTIDNDTLVVQVIVHVSPLASLGGPKNLKIGLDYGQRGASPDFEVTTPLTAVADVVSNDTSNETLPTFVFELAPIRDEGVTHLASKGEVKRFLFELTLAPDSDNNYVIKFLTPINHTGAMEICDVSLVFVGKNMPCLSKALFSGTYTSRVSSLFTDIGTLDIGPVCHFPISDDPEDSKIIFEALSKVTRDNLLPMGEKIWFSSTARVNDDQIYVSQLALILNDIADFNETQYDPTEAMVTFNLTSVAAIWSPSVKYTVPAIVTVPANCSILGFIDAQTPVVVSAVMTLKAIRLVSAGANLACLAKRPTLEYEALLNSSRLTSQLDRGFLDLGIVTNTGVTHRRGTYQPEDDEFLMEFDLQMADSIASTHGSVHTFGMGVKLGTTLVLADQNITVQRDNTEQPELLLAADIADDSVVYGPNMYITINGILKHTNLSTAEGYNVTASFFFPPYLAFEAISGINFSMPEISNASSGHGVAFTFDFVYFTDIIEFNFTLMAVPTGSSQSPFANASTPFEAGANMIWRDNHQNDTGTFFVSRLDSLSFRVIPPFAASCQAVALGMADGNIKDCQIKASSSPYPAKSALDARIGGTSGWTAGARAPKYNKYLEVYFGNITKVTQVSLENPASLPDRVSTYKLFYSDNGINWEEGETVYTDPGYMTDVHTLLAPTDARYMRLMIVDTEAGSNGTAGLKAEFHGCYVSEDVSPEDVCESTRSWARPTTDVAAVMFQRGFLTTAAAGVFLCDSNPEKNDRKECYTSNDGVLWKDLDDTVITILGWDPVEGELYGIAWDQRSFVSSNDQGQTWSAIPLRKYSEVSVVTGFMPATEVPWVTDAQVDITDGVWRTQYDGIYRNIGPWQQVMDWSQCCSP